jgi:hypothetical protein
MTLRFCPSVEELEPRTVPAAHPRLAPPTPQHRVGDTQQLVDVTVALPPGFGWYCEVRSLHKPHARWRPAGPFRNETQAMTYCRRHGFRSRELHLVLPDDDTRAPAQDVSVDTSGGVADTSPGDAPELIGSPDSPNSTSVRINGPAASINVTQVGNNNQVVIRVTDPSNQGSHL